jgi:hypothetical protein
MRIRFRNIGRTRSVHFTRRFGEWVERRATGYLRKEERIPVFAGVSSQHGGVENAKRSILIEQTGTIGQRIRQTSSSNEVRILNTVAWLCGGGTF